MSGAHLIETFIALSWTDSEGLRVNVPHVNDRDTRSRNAVRENDETMPRPIQDFDGQTVPQTGIL
jgi:hypothetical protein